MAWCADAVRCVAASALLQARMLLCGDFSTLPGGDQRRGQAPSNQQASTSAAAPASAAKQKRVGGVLLDVGAGDGSVTSQLATLFDAVVATEVRGSSLGVTISTLFHRRCLRGASISAPRVHPRSSSPAVPIAQVSAPMVKRLEERGFAVLRGPSPDPKGLLAAAAAKGITLPLSSDGEP